ncbi:prolyl aminopeptidase [Alphaproteobacteria bacterium]|nr:prolyl aminopeptidase [Alphaproteobacteria bacterium]
MPRSHLFDREIYPAIQPSASGHHPTGDGHSIYWETVGADNAIPVIFLHGGPGGGLSPSFRRFFDPDRFKVLLFDQRGCGKSQPFGSMENNTTQHLISDIETLRELQGFEQAVIFGGSWGSTLALAYAQAHPQRCLHLVLRGVFLGRKTELDWFMDGMRCFFPETDSDFLKGADGKRGDELLSHYYAQLIDPDPEVHQPAALAWANYEAACTSIIPAKAPHYSFTNVAEAVAIAKAEAHYFVNGLFLSKTPILDSMDQLNHVPGTIIQGRYDVICPPITAYELAKAWPKSKLRIINNAGHSSMESGIRKALVGTMEELKKSLG